MYSRLGSFVAFTFLYLVSHLSEARCLEKKDSFGNFWARDVSRSQGGGWLWFPGRGISENYDTAVLKAEGRALEGLLKECQILHVKTRFIEKCVEEIDGNYVAYTRANILQDDCKSGKFGNIKTREILSSVPLKNVLSKFTKLKNKESVGRKFSKLGCGADNVENCHHLGKISWEEGRNKEALDLLGLGCQKKDVSSCFYAGYLMIGHDEKKARAFSKIACDLKSWASCANLGWIHLVLFKDHKAALAPLKVACNKNHPLGCSLLAFINLENFNNVDRAEDLYIKSCRLGWVDSCRDLGLFYGVYKKDKKKALKFYKLACENENSDACFNLGTIHSNEGDDSSAIDFLKKSCDLNNSDGCFNLASVYENNKAGKDNALKYYEIACNMKNSNGCNNFGMLKVEKGQYKEGLSFLLLSCEMGNRIGCHSVAEVYRDQLKNKKKQKYFLQKSCKMGRKEACHELSKS